MTLHASLHSFEALQAADSLPCRTLSKIETFGLAIGGIEKGHLIWGVITQTNNAPVVGALTGKYVGASADAAFGPGLGANVLVGGSKNAFALQPISVEGEIGINIAAGVTQLTLTAAP